MLPPELLQESFLLHALATDPARVLPPNKSLLAMMARTPPKTHTSALQERVQGVVHQVFWDEALESLSSPSPAVQLPRLKLLYADLRHVLVPLFPPQHPILVTLAAPLSPTSSPLESTRVLLNDVLKALRQRCAPVRDPDIDSLLANLPSPKPLAPLIISTFRDLIALAGLLKHDLTNTLLGAMDDTQLSHIIRQQARERERQLVLHSEMWSSLQNITVLWKTWIGEPHILWTSRLLNALVSPSPVSSQPGPNTLPPQLFFSQSDLLYLQNYLQALVIAASLKALVRTPIQTDFTSRVWSLLKTEIDTPAPSEEDPTKLVHLADEVIRARRLSVPLTEHDESQIRAAVQRTLRLEDPVFALLQGRLVRTLDGRLVDEMAVQDGNSSDSSATNGLGIDPGRLPESMRTGRSDSLNGMGSVRRTPPIPTQAKLHMVVKGFEDEVLTQAIDDAVQKLVVCVRWVKSVWGDTI
ncbi:hypothetical protein H0H92_014458 [Tricholoma furcatifolium]|nr:hypothetical protein H0H92_014458 [Tricholoma furcatifolium]